MLFGLLFTFTKSWTVFDSMWFYTVTQIVADFFDKICQPCSCVIKTVSWFTRRNSSWKLLSIKLFCCRAALLTGQELKYAVRSHVQWFWESDGDILKSTPYQLHYYLFLLVQNLIVSAPDMNKGLFGFGCRSCDWAAVAVLSFLLVLGFPPTLKACTLGWLETLNCT